MTQEQLIAHWESQTDTAVVRAPLSAAAVDGVIAGAAGDPTRMVDLIVMQLVRAVWLDGSLSSVRQGGLEAVELYPALSFQTPLSFSDGA